MADFKKLNEYNVKDENARIAIGLLQEEIEQEYAKKDEVGGDAIIDVNELPTEDIDEKVFYRLIGEEAFTIFQGVKNDFLGISIKMYAVDTLPEVGEYAEGDGSTYMLLYYQRSDNLSYGYLSASTTGSTDMWVETSQIIDLRLGAGYWGGYVEYQDYISGASLENSKAYVIYNENPNIQLYQYKNEWIEIPNLIKIEQEYAKKDEIPSLGGFTFDNEDQTIRRTDSAASITFTSNDTLELTAASSILLNGSHIQSNSDIKAFNLSLGNQGDATIYFNDERSWITDSVENSDLSFNTPGNMTFLSDSGEISILTGVSDDTYSASVTLTTGALESEVDLKASHIQLNGTVYEQGQKLTDKYALKSECPFYVGEDGYIYQKE